MSRQEVIYRHSGTVRITHWINALAMLVMIGSGWEIYNASPLFGFTYPSSITLGGWLAGALIAVTGPVGAGKSALARVLLRRMSDFQANLLAARYLESEVRSIVILPLLIADEAVGVLALRAQDPVQPLDVAVLLPVGVPVELLEFLIAFELTDDPIAVKGDEHAPAHNSRSR